MADICAELITYLKSKSGITALVGSSTGSRIYPDKPKQAVARPLVVVSQAAGLTHRPLSGTAQIQTSTFDIESHADTRAGADALSTAIHAELTPDNKTMGSTFVTQVVTELHRDAGDYLPIDGSDKSVYWCRSRYTLWHLI